jgi:hypothetical protein
MCSVVDNHTLPCHPEGEAGNVQPVTIFAEWKLDGLKYSKSTGNETVYQAKQTNTHHVGISSITFINRGKVYRYIWQSVSLPGRLLTNAESK